MLAVGVGVQKTHRNAFDAKLDQFRHQRLHGLPAQRHQRFAGGVHALRHHQATNARHQGLRPVDIDVVLLKAVLEGHLQHVAVAFGGNQRGFGAAPLDERVGSQRGAVQHNPHLRRLALAAGKHLAYSIHNGRRRFGVGGQHFGGDVAAFGLQHHVGKRAANIHR